ncbi:S46 family peptidase [Oleiagrimonas citrea]|uniref:Dipeptidyl-peptidase n=1 Tax=Oleiagrimonas citrea TaxID=1665687 RepID=A0A846ZL98_9GAMM|nr:S46 family peptidase [Oleiagrimonas citrea]
MRRLLIAAALTASLGMTQAARADEGMWQPSQLPKLAKTLKAEGLKLDPKTLTDLTAYPMGAVVSLGFCTGSFVSPQGLIVTNHHCGYGALQYNSTDKKNLIEDGFLAGTKAAELPGGPNLHIYVTESIRDVTGDIKAAIQPDMTPLDRYNAIDTAEKTLVKQCETSEDFRCDVYSFYGGYRYQLIKQREIKDVRLVYAPPESIGKYGGDVDNWMWPRHTGDFSYLRAYVAPDGRSAAYSKDNVPYMPKHWLKVNPKGLEAGDFAMVVGYPGRTNRYRLAEEVADAIDWRYPTLQKVYGDLLGIIEKAGKADPKVAVKYAGRVASINNGLKNFEGQLAGLTKAHAVEVKRAREAGLMQWLNAHPSAENRALTADIAKLRTLIAAQRANRERNLDTSLATRGLLGTAIQLVRLADERGKPDLEREQGLQKRDEPRIKGRLEQMARRMDPGVDRQMLVYGLQRYVKLPADQRMKALDAWLDGARDPAALEKKAAALYAGTSLTTTKGRLKWFGADAKQIAASDDAMIALARALMPELKQREQEEKAIGGQFQTLRPRYMEAMLAWNRAEGRPIYPDANSSLRVTFGTVRGYSPRDAVEYLPFTTAEGILQKDTGKKPFNAPKAELEAIRAKAYDGYASKRTGSLPVDFLTNVDTTGGNSGSPTLDANGELVGLLFDGNWESVSSDWLFNPKLTRSIHVDVRYMLWVMHHLDHADNLLKEMGVPARR